MNHSGPIESLWSFTIASRADAPTRWWNEHSEGRHAAHEGTTRVLTGAHPKLPVCSHRNSHRGPQSAHRAVAEHHVAAVRTCDVAGDGEAKAAARFVLIAGVVEAQKRLEYVVSPVRRNAGAVVIDRDGHVAVVAVTRDGDGRAKASGVGNEVGQTPFEGMGPHRGHRITMELDLRPAPVALGVGLQFIEECRHVGRLGTLAGI